MDYDRLRELQEKFDESPRRYFAPLANEYRKGGQYKRAIEICRAHLAQMPGHMSGQIVFGQALFEAGEWDEARTVFGRALALDPENLIALRSLGDMSLQAGNTEEARTWYTRLLDADPKDTTVIALISQIDAPAEAASPSAAAGGTIAREPLPEAKPLSPVPAPLPEAKPLSPVPEPASTEIAEPLGLERHYPSESLEEAGSQEQLAAETGEAIAGITSAREDDAGALDWGPSAAMYEEGPGEVPAPAATEPGPRAAEPEPRAAEYEPPTIDDEAPAPEYQGAAAEYDLPATEHEPAPPEYEPASAESEPVSTRSESASLEPEPLRSAPQAEREERFTGASAEPFVNETMAQLYLQQGYRQLALKVYRQLSASRPHDQSLRDRIAEIEAADAAEHPDEVPAMRREEPSIEAPAEPATPRSPSIESPTPWSQPGSEESPEFDRSPVDSPPTEPPVRERESVESPSRDEQAGPDGYAARQPSVREFFATLGRRRPPRPTGTQPMRSGNNLPADSGGLGSVVPPAASLDAVFAGATVSAADARAAARLAGAFSGATGGGSRTPPTPAVPTPRVNPRLQQTHESEEDVAKFRAWLDGLTRE
ncbi:MAG: tetratricopeptide repeat protein [Gemmatimonadota bacterium]|nr:tetratricopeptide repeat protein [Gemmatimonadota bacterium]